MLPFSAILLRDYYKSIGWNEDNTYSQLTRSSSGESTPSELALLSAALTDFHTALLSVIPHPDDGY